MSTKPYFFFTMYSLFITKKRAHVLTLLRWNLAQTWGIMSHRTNQFQILQKGALSQKITVCPVAPRTDLTNWSWWGSLTACCSDAALDYAEKARVWPPSTERLHLHSRVSNIRPWRPDFRLADSTTFSLILWAQFLSTSHRLRLTSAFKANRK